MNVEAAKQVNLNGEEVPSPEISEHSETKEYLILIASRYYLKLTDEAWEKLLGSNNAEIAQEKKERIKN